MKQENLNPRDARLSSLLRESCVVPAAPPRFQENVWRRIADVEAAKSADAPAWLGGLIAWVMRPRLALAALMALVLMGALFGVREGHQLARNDAQARYLAAVAPNSLR